MGRLTGLLGIVVILAVAWAFSSKKNMGPQRAARGSCPVNSPLDSYRVETRFQ